MSSTSIHLKASDDANLEKEPNKKSLSATTIPCVVAREVCHQDIDLLFGQSQTKVISNKTSHQTHLARTIKMALDIVSQSLMSEDQWSFTSDCSPYCIEEHEFASCPLGYYNLTQGLRCDEKEISDDDYDCASLNSTDSLKYYSRRRSRHSSDTTHSEIDQNI